MVEKVPPGHMRLFSGQLVDPLNLRPDQVRFDDICFALGNFCRYGGHCHCHFSVAEHTLDVFNLVRFAGGNRDEQLYALIHDASEAYTGDIPQPIKERLGIRKIEEQINKTVAIALGLEPDRFLYAIEQGIVKRFDVDAGSEERSWLWTPEATHRDAKPRHWGKMLHSQIANTLIARGFDNDQLVQLGVFKD